MYLMGQGSALGRDERLFRLKVAIDQGNVKTFQSARKYMLVSEKTLLSYLKDLDIALYDPDKESFRGGSQEIPPF